MAEIVVMHKDSPTEPDTPDEITVATTAVHEAYEEAWQALQSLREKTSEYADARLVAITTRENLVATKEWLARAVCKLELETGRSLVKYANDK